MDNTKLPKKKLSRRETVRITVGMVDYRRSLQTMGGWPSSRTTEKCNTAVQYRCAIGQSKQRIHRILDASMQNGSCHRSSDKNSDRYNAIHGWLYANRSGVSWRRQGKGRILWHSDRFNGVGGAVVNNGKGLRSHCQSKVNANISRWWFLSVIWSESIVNTLINNQTIRKQLENKRRCLICVVSGRTFIILILFK